MYRKLLNKVQFVFKCSTMIRFVFLYILVIKAAYTNYYKTRTQFLDTDIALRENFVIEGYEFLSFSYQVNWYEANQICKGYGGYLAILNDVFIVRVFTDTLPDAIINSRVVLVGGHKTLDGLEWFWLNDEEIPTDNTSVLPWIHDPLMDRDCLGIERIERYKIFLISVHCTQKKPFVCQRDANSHKILITNHPPKVIDKTHYIFNTPMTFNEALATCRENNLRLASQITKNSIKKMSKQMLKARPSIEYLWLSGFKYDYEWIWLPDGKKIKSTTTVWYEKEKTHKKCLMLDRHMNDTVSYISEVCEKKSPFLCQTDSPSQDETDVILIETEELIMYLHLQNLSWDESINFCHGKNSYLVETQKEDTLEEIATILSGLTIELNNFWMGGIYENQKWIWHHSKKPISEELPWLDDEADDGNICLNFDRHWHDKPQIYGLKCKRRQPFICVPTNKIRTFAIEEKPQMCSPLEFFAQKKNFVVHYKPLVTGKSASEFCTTKSHLKLARLHTNIIGELSAIIKTKNCPTQQFYYKSDEECSSFDVMSNKVLSGCNRFRGVVCENTTIKTPCQDDLLTFSIKHTTFVTQFQLLTYNQAKEECTNIGGVLLKNEDKSEIFINSVGKKIKKESNIKCFESELWVETNKTCSVIHISNNHIDKTPNCYGTFGATCEVDCSSQLQVDKFDYKTWTCENHDDTKVCQAECPKDRALLGPIQMFCRRGWRNQINRRLKALPKCLEPNQIAADILELIHTLRETYDGMLFLMQEPTQKGTDKNYVTRRRFAMAILGAFPAKDNWPVGFITFSSKANVVIPYNETDNCWIVSVIKNMYSPNIFGFHHYVNALTVAEEQIDALQPQRKTILVFISVGHDSNNNFIKRAMEIKKRHFIISIVLAEHIHKNVLSVASTFKNLHLKNYYFSYYKTMKQTSAIIERDTLSNSNCDV